MLGRFVTYHERRNSVSNSSYIISNSLINRILRNRGESSNTIVQLEEEIDVVRNLELYNNHQINVLNPRILYQTGALNINTVLIRSSREEVLRVVDNTQTVDLFSPNTINKIKRSNKRFVNIGLVVIRIKGLGRRELGTKILTLLLDKSWKTNVKKQ